MSYIIIPMDQTKLFSDLYFSNRPFRVHINL